MYLILIVMVVTNAMVFLDQTILPVALPTIQKEFLSSESALHWMIDGYFLSLAALMLAGGRIADIFGLRRIFSLGMLIFGVASFFCGLSGSSNQLIFSRIIQGIGGALMIPPSLPILLKAFPGNKKGMATGLVVALSAAFMIFGPFIGGFFSEYLNWRYVFWINLPISFIGLVLTMLFIPKSVMTKRHFDFLGFGCYTLGIILLTIALIQLQSWGWSSFPSILMFILGSIFLLLLYFTDKKSKDPFINFSLFKNKIFSGSALNIFSAAFALIITVFLPIYMQRIFNFSLFTSGYYMMLTSIPMTFAAPLAGKISDYMGPKKPITFSQLLLILSFLCIAVFLPVNNFWFIFPILFFLPIAFTSIFTCSFAVGISAIELENRGQASGLLGTIRSLGINFGVAIMGSLIVDISSSQFSAKLLENTATNALNPKIFEGAAQKSNLQTLSPALQKTVTDFFNDAYMMAFQYVNITEAMIVLISLIGMFLFFKKRAY
ncbi:MAG: MFS transporter [Chlamydiae bacterium]|nr:MFS transporter [Chlamydiota bacterium]